MEDDTLREGRARLRALLPWARGEALRMGYGLTLVSGLAKGQGKYVTEDNLDALLIYPAPLGGWHADVLLKSTPPGVPNTLGTPVASPCATREEAEQIGKRLLASILMLCEQNRRGEISQAPPAFLLYDYSVELAPAILAFGANCLAPRSAEYPSPEFAARRIGQMVDRIFPNGFNGKLLGKLSKKDWDDLFATLHIAALAGLFAYPIRRDTAPSGQTEAELSNEKH